MDQRQKHYIREGRMMRNNACYCIDYSVITILKGKKEWTYKKLYTTVASSVAKMFILVYFLPNNTEKGIVGTKTEASLLNSY